MFMIAADAAKGKLNILHIIADALGCADVGRGASVSKESEP